MSGNSFLLSVDALAGVEAVGLDVSEAETIGLSAPQAVEQLDPIARRAIAPLATASPSALASPFDDLDLDLDLDAATAEASADEAIADRALADLESANRPSALVPFKDELPAGVALATHEKVLKSELEGVSDAAWTDFALAMKTAQPMAVSASNDLGMFAMRPRRLADLGLMKEVKRMRAPTGRMIWMGEFVPPLTQKKFLSSPKAQYAAFVKSMKDYAARLRSGSIAKPDGGCPKGMSLSGVLAILHRCGPSGLKTWNDEANRFADTIFLYEAANGAF